MSNPILNAGDLIAGAAAEGQGALCGWFGLGTLIRSFILACLERAGLAVEWAPRSKSAVAYAGNAVGSLNSRGYIARRAKGASKRANGLRDYRARWTVAQSASDVADVGDAAGRVVLTVELRDGSDDLILEGDASLTAQVRERYLADRDAEVYQAAEVTDWLARLLVKRAGAVRFGTGYYVPITGRPIASAIARELCETWGRGWIYPLLPVASSAELATGIARGLSDDVTGVVASQDAATKAAIEAGKSQISPAVAARLLADLSRVEDRVNAYRALCGDAPLASPRAEIARVREILEGLSDDTSQRFALIGADLPAQAPAQVAREERSAPAFRAAERALAERLAAPAGLAAWRPGLMVQERERAASIDGDALYQRELIERTAARPIDEDDDTAQRFALLDLDNAPRVAAQAEPVEEIRSLDLNPIPEAREAAELAEPNVVEIIEDDGNLLIDAPYVASAITAWRQIPGRRWNKTRGVNVVPRSARKQVWALLQEHYHGATLRSAKGERTID